MIRTLVAACALAFTASSALAGMITVESTHDVKTTIDRLEAAVNGAGATVFARIDHKANAEKAGLEQPASQVLIFGNPKMGTPMMNASGSVGLDLPLRVHAFDKDGKTLIMYHDPIAMAKEHGASCRAQGGAGCGRCPEEADGQGRRPSNPLNRSGRRPAPVSLFSQADRRIGQGCRPASLAAPAGSGARNPPIPPA